jgi:predicted dienelactone hydrolase
LFSPGVGESLLSYEYLCRRLAANGYVVLLANHVGTDAAITIGQRPLTPVLIAAASDGRNQIDRALDLRFVLDRMGAEPMLIGRIDPQRIAVAGHSLGAHSALALCGLTFDAARASADRPAIVLRDERVRACIALSPPGSGMLGLDQTSWSDVVVPLLTLHGEFDTDVIVKDPTVRRAGFDMAASADAALVVIAGAEHETFTGRDPAFPLRSDAVRHQALIATVVTAWLDAFLLDEPAAAGWLLDGGLGGFCAGGCGIEHRSLTAPWSPTVGAAGVGEFAYTETARSLEPP